MKRKEKKKLSEIYLESMFRENIYGHYQRDVTIKNAAVIDANEGEIMAYWEKNKTLDGLNIRRIGDKIRIDLETALEGRKPIPGLARHFISEIANAKLGERHYGEKGDKKKAIQIATCVEHIINTYQEEGSLESLDLDRSVRNKLERSYLAPRYGKNGRERKSA